MDITLDDGEVVNLDDMLAAAYDAGREMEKLNQRMEQVERLRIGDNTAPPTLDMAFHALADEHHRACHTAKHALKCFVPHQQLEHFFQPMDRALELMAAYPGADGDDARRRLAASTKPV